jgi:hypothetical protein
VPWLRLWDDALDCPKVHRLKPEVFRAWIFLLLAAKRHGEEGLLPSLDTIAFWMRADASQVRGWIEDLTKAGMIDQAGEGHVIHDWDYWQQPPDRTAAQRMRRHRESRKKGSDTSQEREESRAEQSESRRRNASVTPSVTQRNVTAALRRNAAVTPEAVLSAAPATHSHARSLDETTTGRKGDEHKLFVQAVSELEAHEPTEYLAGSLVMAADTPSIRDLESWRLLVAARTVQKPNKSKTWGLFEHVAHTCTEADYRKLCRPLSNGQPSPSKPGGSDVNQPVSAMNPPPGLEVFAAESAALMAKYQKQRRKTP